jgi:hypothetical protein
LRRLLLFALVLTTAAVLPARAARVKPPLPAQLPLRDGSTLRGSIFAYDQVQVFLESNGRPTPVNWADVQPRAVLALGERLIGPRGTARQWLELGRRLAAVPDGMPLTRRPFAIALRLDPSLNSEVEAARHPGAASRPGDDTASASPDADRSPTSSSGAASATAWPELTDEQRAQATAAMERLVTRLLADAQSPAKLTLYETRYFLLYTDLSHTEAVRWQQVLDRMYARLAQLFGLPDGQNIWRGKAAILVFAQRPHFQEFEKKAFQTKRDAGGWCHGMANGDVLITFFRGPSDAEFARVLVHESTHGFLHRYRGRPHIPSWLNEGLAEVMEYELVPGAGVKQAADAAARVAVRRPNALKAFFDKPIEFDQYPIARTLTEFMIRHNKSGYVGFINAIKDGQAWEPALKATYGVSRDDLIRAYGAEMGVANLEVPTGEK